MKISNGKQGEDKQFQGNTGRRRWRRGYIVECCAGAYMKKRWEVWCDETKW